MNLNDLEYFLESFCCTKNVCLNPCIVHRIGISIPSQIIGECKCNKSYFSSLRIDIIFFLTFLEKKGCLLANLLFLSAMEYKIILFRDLVTSLISSFIGPITKTFSISLLF